MAASAIIAIHDHKVLLILRDNIPHIVDPNTWALPGGMLHLEEEYLAAAKREFAEELNIVPHELLPFGRITLPGYENNVFYISHLTDNEREKLVLGNEGQKFDFFTSSDIRHLKLDTILSHYFIKYSEYLSLILQDYNVKLNPVEFGLNPWD